jgi:predicted RNase H-like nuclease (RuvC/YqgF family)
MLAPVTVEASRGRSWSNRLDPMADVRAAQYENRHLTRQLAQYDREVSRLETRLVYLKTVVTDSLRRNIAATDSTTAAVHAERLRLEERLRLTGAAPLAVADSVGGAQ